MTTATESIAAIIRRDTETGTKNYAANYGDDWFNLTPAEAEVFDLSLDDLPSLVAVWCAYEGVLGITDVLPIPDHVAAAFRGEHAFIAEDFKSIDGRSTISAETFEKFAKLFGVSYRKAHGWFHKFEFFQCRCGIITFHDEAQPAYDAPTPEGEDDEVPF